jgi:hypothetical protein
MWWTNTILRWVLAPFGGALALVLGAAFPTVVAFLFFTDATMDDTSSVPSAVTIALMMMCSMASWAWAGSAIAPERHRRIALVVFSSPVVLLTVLLFWFFASGERRPGLAPTVIGLVLACVGILVLALNRQLRTPGREGHNNIERIAEVFSDDPVQKAKA